MFDAFVAAPGHGAPRERPGLTHGREGAAPSLKPYFWIGIAGGYPPETSKSIGFHFTGGVSCASSRGPKSSKKFENQEFGKYC
jgi:hypothetical protein